MYKTEVFIDKVENREDSFWNYDQTLAKVQFPNGKKLYIESRGKIRVQLEEDGTYLKGWQAVQKAIDLGYTDEDLAKLNERDGWDMNNWFVVIEVDIDGEDIGDDLAICGDYDEAIEMLDKIAKEKDKEYYS